MNETILFSPVGGTDPISSSNCRDGSMLHICRVYKPSKVILYMSKQMLEWHKKDNRYCYCLDRLAELQNRKIQYGIVERPNLSNVQEFDYFYQDFRKIISILSQKMDETDTLLINISSGTPAMKSGLLVLQTLGEFPCQLIQVVTPERGINEHSHKDYDVETLWELNEDNRDDFENRCKLTNCPTLSMIKNEEIMKKHISVYDYQAAAAVARTMPPAYTVKYLPLLEMAEARLLLDFRTVDRKLSGQSRYQIPERQGNNRKYFEYALTLDIKLKRGEYADFIRSITPLLVDLFELILKNGCGIDVDHYCRTNSNGVRTWDTRKLAGTTVKNVLDANYTGGFRPSGMISSDHLMYLIQHFSTDSKMKALVSDLRSVETSIRNLAAHEIVSVTDATIQAKTGFTGQQIMRMIKEVFAYTGIRVKKEYWNSYDEMNQLILELMK